MAPEQGYGWPFQLLYQNCGHPGAELINLFVSVTDAQQKRQTLYRYAHFHVSLGWEEINPSNIRNIHINAVSIVP